MLAIVRMCKNLFVFRDIMLKAGKKIPIVSVGLAAGLRFVRRSGEVHNTKNNA